MWLVPYSSQSPAKERGETSLLKCPGRQAWLEGPFVRLLLSLSPLSPPDHKGRRGRAGEEGGEFLV